VNVSNIFGKVHNGQEVDELKKLKRKVIHEEMKSWKIKVTLNVGVCGCEVGTSVVRASILQGKKLKV
jgi:hypothetical protein